ncbi:MAG: outer membrane beta-barrel protein [Bacteroidales bacterium]|nr:outer membrane beta-barrel protein [Bacteroidales bacterium]
MYILRKTIALLLFTFSISVIFAQSPQNINIKGRIIDSLGETVPAATVMLLTSSDSTLVNYTTSDSDGKFSFRSIKNRGYLLKISHIGFMPIQKQIPVINQDEYNFGNITVEPIAEILMEVVIKSAQAPLFIHGDTVEYDARLFKVPPGSTVEDLLKRLPGIEVDESGGITTMGKNIGRVYVDGKTFFGDDPKSVTKNLDAEAISKVQVYNDKSEQERLTGIKDGSDNKAMNLELKEEYKKGYFGKASVAAGTEERWAGRGSFNRFNETSQLSFLAYGNNLNSTGVNWEDYQEFKGSSAYSDYDNGDFGFNARGRGHYSMSFGSNYSGKGFSESYGGGANYNYFKDKIKFNVSYMFSQSDIFYDQFTKRQTFLTDTSFFRYDTTKYDRLNNSHSISSRLEIEFDTSNTFIFRINSRLSNSALDNLQKQLFQTDAPLYSDINLNSFQDESDVDAYSVNILSLYNHKFAKKGRSFSISGAADISNNNSGRLTDNINEYFITLTQTEQLKYLYDNTSSDELYKSSIMYVEPLSKRFSLMGFYNISSNETQSEKIVTDELSVNNTLVDSMTNFYIHTVLYNRLGSSFSYAWEGLNISLGGAYQIIDMKGRYAMLQELNDYNNLVPKSYNNFVPYFRTDWQLPNNIRLSLNYSYEIDEPTMSQLQPITDNSNPLYKVEGNLALTPKIYHSINGGIYYWNQASFSSFSVHAGTSINETSIVYNQNTIFKEGVGYVTTSKPENVEGGQSTYAYFWGSVPIIKTILTLNLSGNVSFSNSPVFINGIENITNSEYYRVSLGLNLTLGPKLSFNFGGNLSQNDVKYSIQNTQNQKIIGYSTSGSFKWQIFKKTFIEGNLDWDNYESNKLDYKADILVTNLSVRQVLGEKNRFEMRLAGFDLLNQKQYLYQIASENYTEYTIAPTLARYFMLSVAYNLKGFETKIKKNRY